MKTIRITHTNGDINEAPLTPRVICEAEEHAQARKMGRRRPPSRIRQAYYMAYLAAKFAELTTADYDAWLDGVDVDGRGASRARRPDAGNPTD